MERTEIYNQFEELNKRASQGGGIDKIEKQHAAGRMTARERIEALLDKGTFNELDKFVNHRCTNFGMEKKQIPGDGMVTGYGKIDGRPVFVYAYDFTVHGGSLSETNAAKIVKVQQLALKNGAPVIALNDSGPYSGRCRQFVRICFYFLSEYDCFRGDPSNLSYSGSMCRRCLLFTCIDGFYFYGEREKSYVHHRAGCSENGYA